MYYDGIIRIQNINNTKYVKEMSQTVNSLYSQSGYEALSNAVRNANKAITSLYRSAYMESFSNAVSCLSRNGSMVNYLHNSINTYNNLKYVLSSCLRSVLKDSSLFPSFSVLHKAYKRNLFFYIADNMGFPIYLEVDSELQDMLIESYKENGNQCNKKEMRQIILDYYNDDYVDYIFQGIKNVQIFNLERVILIEEGIGTYKLERYGSSASLFVAQLSGMIRDVYEELSSFYRFSKKDKNELLINYNQNCKPDSEKGMLFQIVNIQSKGIMLWNKVLWHFLNVVYSTRSNDIVEQPNRNMICHGKQTNYNTKEMNLQLIMCMDIITELAWRIKDMKKYYIKGERNV